MKLVTIWRIVLAGSRNFLRNAWLSTAATAVMTVTLTIILFSYISNLALTSTIENVVQKIDLSVYIKDSVSEDQVKNLQEQLSKLENVQSVKYVSKAEALEIYRQQFANDKKVLDAINETDNPLPRSLQIKARDQNKIDPIISFLEQPTIRPLFPEDDKNAFSYTGERKKAIDRIIGGSNFLRRLGVVGSLVFLVISILIIFNTIRMAIFTRREEIEIMKLVGATNWFIRGPFMFEAALYGIIAAILASTLCYSLLLGAGPKLSNYIDVNSAIALFRSQPVLIVLAELGMGLLIGIGSSLLAMVRYLKL